MSTKKYGRMTNASDNTITDYMRPEKAAMMRRKREPFLNPPMHELREIGNGAVIPAFRHESGELLTGVVDADNSFVDMSREVYHPHDIEEKAAAAEFVMRDETAVYVGYFNSHWGHFTVDCLPCFWFLWEHTDADKYVFSFDEEKTPEIPHNIREALELLGVWNKVEIISSPTRFRHLYVPTKGLVSEEYMLPESIKVFDRIVENALNTPCDRPLPDKLLMSRARLPKAKLNDLGTENVEGLFTANGFEAVYPEQMSLTELIWYLSRAKETVAISGTLMHNMLFAPQGSRLTVIEKYANINTFQSGIDLVRELNTTYIDAYYFIKPVEPGLGPFIMGPTPQLQQFAADRGMRYSIKPINPRATLRKFFTLYRRHYKRQWIMPWWLDAETGSMREAYDASQALFGPWLKGDKAVFVSDMLNPRFLARKLKSALKR